MDVFTLRSDDSYIADRLIERCYSKIWTERHFSPGEFELDSYNVDAIMDLLPEKTLISHRNTKEVMAVEDRIITYDDNDVPSVKIVGRSLTAFPENRTIRTKYQKKRKLAKKYTPAGAAAVLLYNALDNDSGKDLSRDGDYSYSVLNKLPNVSISDSVSDPGDGKNWWVEAGALDGQLWDILNRGDLGLRMIRPMPGVSANIVTVDSALATRGDINRTIVGDVSSLRFDVYQGVDRSANQTLNERVVFFAARGDIDDASYLFSIKNYRTFCELLSSIDLPPVARPGEAAYSGFDRRVTVFDAGEPEFPDEPEKPEAPDPPKSTASDTVKANYRDALDEYRTDLDIWRPKHDAWVVKRDGIIEDFSEDSEDAALKDLNKKRRVSVLTGTASPDSPYKYGVDYNLGDYVTLNGAYGQSQRMIVSEYVLSEDSTGETGNPGFSLP